MPVKLTGIEVFGQTPGTCLLFRTCKTQRRANYFVWLYTKMGYTNMGSKLYFDSAPVGEGWV